MLVLTMVAASVMGLGAIDAAEAQTNPHQRGPDPTEATFAPPQGPFAIQTQTVPAGNGFGGGTIYYPTDTSQGTFGAVAISPGWTESQSAISWLGPRLASHGFVIFTIDVNNTLLDFPDARGQQLQAALDFLVGPGSGVGDRIDGGRLGVMGHSMGGGGTLRAANDNPNMQAAIPLAGWHTTTNWSGVDAPTLVIGAQNDAIAGVAQHSEPFYESLGSSEKAYLELAGANHFTTNSENATVARYSISWLKRFIDDDTRYEQFLCPAPGTGLQISEYRDTCPHDAGGGGTPPTDPPEEECAWWDFLCWFS